MLSILKLGSILPKRLIDAFLAFKLNFLVYFSQILSFFGCSDICKGTFL